jgi:hypothetical protein
MQPRSPTPRARFAYAETLWQAATDVRLRSSRGTLTAHVTVATTDGTSHGIDTIAVAGTFATCQRVVDEDPDLVTSIVLAVFIVVSIAVLVR